MCTFVSFKCVYKGIVSETEKIGENGIVYDDLRARVPNNGTPQFIAQFRRAIVANEIHPISDDGRILDAMKGDRKNAVPYSMPYMFKWVHKNHAVNLVFAELELARKQIKELEGKLALVQDTFDNLFSKAS